MRKPGTGAKTNSQYEARLTEVWRQWNRGQRQWQIAQALGITDRQVRYDLKTLENRWRKETSAGMATHKEAELAKIHELWLTYWESWLKSCEAKQTTSTEQSDSDTGKRLKAALKKEQRDGNPAFLAGCQWCIERKCKILGLDAPVQIDLTRLNTEELIRFAQAVFGPTSADRRDPGLLADRPSAGALPTWSDTGTGPILDPGDITPRLDPSGPRFDID